MDIYQEETVSLRKNAGCHSELWQTKTHVLVRARANSEPRGTTQRQNVKNKRLRAQQGSEINASMLMFSMFTQTVEEK